MLIINRKYEAFLDKMDEIVILVPMDLDKDQKSFYIEEEEDRKQLKKRQKINISTHMKYVCQVPESIQFGKMYTISDESGNKTDLQIGCVIRSTEFDQLFAYDGDDLGAVYTKEKTICKVWAPTATHVKLRVYDKDEATIGTYDMLRDVKGTWSYTLEGDYDGIYYTYLACVNLIWREAVDPYAKSVSINGRYGVIVDREKTKVAQVSPPEFRHKTDAIIYEAHIRDFSVHEESGMVHKGKYQAWLEENTTNKKGDSTGISYLSELGITHVELLPVNDFEEVDERNPSSSYNWGYNPLHYFAPEGSYSLDPQDPYKRIIELKSVIQKLHSHGIRVIVDVVYNHVYSKENSSFDKLVPGYYFRYDANGMPSNGTGVGNDLASERFMVRKFIIDCACYWMKEYNIDGFRFDLMGIIDIDTMVELQKKVYEIKSDAILLGEGWDLNTPLPKEKKTILTNASQTPSISFFNDQFRDIVKGSTFNINDCGFVYGNLVSRDMLEKIISGSPHQFIEPHQSINYVESHDNHTMWDRFLTFCPDEEGNSRKARHRLATSIVLLSQGVPFLHAGQEFFRTKNGVENSYNSPDHINWLDWGSRSNCKDNVEYIKGLIKLRKLHAAFRLPSADLIKKHLMKLNEHPHLISYQLKDVKQFGPWNTILVIHHNLDNQSFTFTLPEGDWQLVVNPEKVLLDELPQVKRVVEINKLGTYVFCKN